MMQDPLPTSVLTTEEELSQHRMAYTTFWQICVLDAKQIVGERKGQFVHFSAWCGRAEYC